MVRVKRPVKRNEVSNKRLCRTMQTSSCLPIQPSRPWMVTAAQRSSALSTVVRKQCKKKARKKRITFALPSTANTRQTDEEVKSTSSMQSEYVLEIDHRRNIYEREVKLLKASLELVTTEVTKFHIRKIRALQLQLQVARNIARAKDEEASFLRERLLKCTKGL